MRLLKILFLLCCAALLFSTQGLRGQTVTITYLQNDGVFISDGSNKVLLDAIFNPISSWINLNASEATKLNNAQEPYDDVDLILITHNHGDHYSVAPVNTHLNNNANARLIAPPPVTVNFSGSQIVNVSPARGESETLTVNGIEVEVLHLRHFDAFGNDFSSVQNFGYLVKIGGTNILHLGDVEMTVQNLQAFGLAARGIDVVLIPTFTMQAHLTTSHRDALMSQIQPDNIIALHLLSGNISSIQQQVNNLYPGATVFTTPLQTFTLNVTSIAGGNHTPERFNLMQNYPNPFNPTTTISYSLPQTSKVSLTIHNLLGQQVRSLVQNKTQSAGTYAVQWNGKDDSGKQVATGTYFYKIQAGDFVQRRKLVLLR